VPKEPTQELKEPKVPQVIQELKVLRVHKEGWVVQAFKELKEPKVLKGLIQVLKEPQDRQVPKEP
jgi:hypothetical protein